jgi:hypothetical protein
MALTDEEELLEKLRKIEALHAGATTDGERAAAANVAEKIRARLKEFEAIDPPVEYSFTVMSLYSKRLLIALLRRYEISPYRYRGQRWSTVRARVPVGFVDRVLWPEYQQLMHALDLHLSTVTDRIIHAVIHKDTSDEKEVVGPKQLS